MSKKIATEYKHILLGEGDVPLIEGTSMKIVELITSVQAYGWSPEELHFQYPHISLSKIHSILNLVSIAKALLSYNHIFT